MSHIELDRDVFTTMMNMDHYKFFHEQRTIVIGRVNNDSVVSITGLADGFSFTGTHYRSGTGKMVMETEKTDVNWRFLRVMMRIPEVLETIKKDYVYTKEKFRTNAIVIQKHVRGRLARRTFAKRKRRREEEGVDLDMVEFWEDVKRQRTDDASPWKPCLSPCLSPVSMAGSPCFLPYGSPVQPCLTMDVDGMTMPELSL